MHTLLEMLYNLLSHITEDHFHEVPGELKDVLNNLCDKLGDYLQNN